MKTATVRSEINVTPLVDVCLVLLIIFMVVTPLLVKDAGVDLPETLTPESMPEGRDQLDVAIKLDGSLYLRGQVMPRQNLQAALRDLYQQSIHTSVVIEADERLAYESVRELLRLVNRAGFTSAGIETRKSEPSR